MDWVKNISEAWLRRASILEYPSAIPEYFFFLSGLSEADLASLHCMKSKKKQNYFEKGLEYVRVHICYAY